MCSILTRMRPGGLVRHEISKRARGAECNVYLDCQHCTRAMCEYCTVNTVIYWSVTTREADIINRYAR